MKHICNLISTTQALRHVFVSPSQFIRFQLFRSTTLPTLNQSRFLHVKRRLSPAQSTGTGSQPRDEEIRAEFVQVVNENNSLDPPIRLRDVLHTFNRSENYLQQVSPTLPGKPPVCKIVNRVAMRELERSKAKAAHAAKAANKQIELNWAIDAHDLDHRLKQLTTFLEKGRKVEVVLTRKRGKRAPTVEEIKHLMDSVISTIKEANAMQIRPIEGEPGKHVVLIVKKE
ncbi:hypothetical protein EYZ11_009469 [Aspergillus tanneri]|uniref:Translation initiation factor 3 C-terminal domain-containing protein n=1 Tax=Aspergillus tanneri TaxID=1220188 RepID=A0A4V3UNF9_9EURO|nr:uncharacterized protein ATNIH1004_000790 [Aspergillus tanneri]KAA8651891.1 hypothetical protein ATNIH1004_000790 [Aspergillus tanneri]THC91084.1 hypothetical protein EYZ11_009469 [Aspergillus tanneri]